MRFEGPCELLSRAQSVIELLKLTRLILLKINKIKNNTVLLRKLFIDLLIYLIFLLILMVIKAKKVDIPVLTFIFSIISCQIPFISVQVMKTPSD